MSWWDERSANFDFEGPIERIDRQWLDGRLPDLTFVGSTDGPEGSRLLVVGVNPDRDLRPFAYAPTAGVIDRWNRSLIRRYGPLPSADQLRRFRGQLSSELLIERRGALARLTATAVILRRIRRSRSPGLIDATVLLPYRTADPETVRELDDVGVPESTLVIYLQRAQPAGLGLGVVEPDFPPGSLGLLLETTGGLVACTAGHCAHHEGHPVFASERRWFGRRRWSWIGDVARRTSPDRVDLRHPTLNVPSGADIALIRVVDDRPLAELSRAATTRRIVDLRRNDILAWRGLASGSVDGMFVARAERCAFSESTDYMSCLAIGLRGGAARQGDSGAPVTTFDGSIVGYITRVFGTNERGLYQGCVVQAIDVAVDYAQHDFGVMEIRTFE